MNYKRISKFMEPALKATFTTPDLGGAVNGERQTIHKPYAANSDLPPEVRSALPEAAQTIWRKAFNAALEQYGNEEQAFKVAWAAVKNEFKQDEDGRWIHKAAEDFTGTLVGMFVPRTMADTLLAAVDADIAQKATELHMTIGYLGEAEDYDEATKAKLLETVRNHASSELAVSGTFHGIARWSGEEQDAVVALFDSPILADWRARLVEKLDEEDIIVDRSFGFVPHVTLAYVDKDKQVNIRSLPDVNVTFDDVTVAFGNDRTKFPLQRAEAYKFAYAITKAQDEKRYTLGPVYAPNKLDHHGEFIEPDELQEAIWDYVKKGDRKIHLQHTEEVAGEWVEILTWPYRVSAQLSLPGEKKKSRVVFPANTVFMGVIWEPKYWDAVKGGQLTGYSIGGRATRVEVDFKGR